MRTAPVTLEELLLLALVEDSGDWDAAELGIPEDKTNPDTYRMQEQELEHFATIAVTVCARFRKAIARAQAVNGPVYRARSVDITDMLARDTGEPKESVYVCDGEHALPACPDSSCVYRPGGRARNG